MAVIHDAVLSPSKLDAIAGWLPAQPWSGTDTEPELALVGRFRFDDPAGEVGVETMLVRVGDGPVLQVPLTYRGAPLAGAESFLVTEMDHSVLGRRWVYDAAGDPVYADVVRRAIVTGGHEAALESAETGGAVAKEGTAVGSGSDGSSPSVESVRAATDGDVTSIETGAGALDVLRVLGTDVPSGETLTATWGDDASAVVVVLRR
jgi:hypothetical protein